MDSHAIRIELSKCYGLLTAGRDAEDTIEEVAGLIHRLMSQLEDVPVKREGIKPSVISSFVYTTEAEVRAEFWKETPEHAKEFRPSRRHDSYPLIVLNAWEDFIDELSRAEEISDELAAVVTLG